MHLRWNVTHECLLSQSNEENCFKIQFSAYIDNFEQYFDSSLLTTQNDSQSFFIKFEGFSKPRIS